MIELKSVTKSYRDGFTALEDVDLQIADGEFVFIVGGSGAGKSTLTKLLIAEEKPTAGSVTVGEWAVSALKKKQIPYYRRRIGIVFRDFRLFSDKTVFENVAFALRVIGENAASIRLKVNAALRMVELSDKSRNYPDQLSAEQQQRVALARALAGSPDVIIADEPAGNVDPVQSRLLMELFSRIQSRYNKTVIVLTHDKELAESFGKRMVCLERGKIVADIAANRIAEELLAELAQTESAQEESLDGEGEELPPSLPASAEEGLAATVTVAAVTEGAELAEALDALDVTAEALAEPTEVPDEMLPLSKEESPEEGEDEGTTAEALKEDAEETLAATSEVTTEEMTAEESADQPADTAMEPAVEATEAPAVEAVDAPVAEPAVDPLSAEDLPVQAGEPAKTEAENIAAAPEITPDAVVPASEEATVAFPAITPVVEERVEGAEVHSVTISTDTLEAVLADLFSGVSVEDAISTDRSDLSAKEEQK